MNKYLLLILPVFFSLYWSCKTSKVFEPGKKVLSEKERMELMEYFMEGNKEKLLGNQQRAADNFNKCLKIEPRHAASLYELATIYEYQGRNSLSLSLIKQASEADPANEWYRVSMANIYAKNGKFEEAVRIYKALAKEFPQKIEYHYECANMLIYNNKLKEAIEVYEGIEKKVGITEEISLQKERLWLRLGNTDKAIEELKKLIGANPVEAQYYGLLAEIYQSKGMKEKVLETYEQLKKISPDNPYMHLAMSNYYRDMGEKEKSYNELKQAFASPDLDIDTKMHILLSYYTLTEKQNELVNQAMELSNILIEVHPEDPKSHTILGDFLLRDKLYDKARISYRKAAQLDKSRFAIWNQLLLIESELKDYESMLKESEEAMELFPNQPAFFFFNGFALIQKKHYENALIPLNKGKDIVFNNNPLLVQFYANLGDAYYQLKNYPMSDSSYGNALLIDPRNIYVLNNYSYYLSLRGEHLEKAEKMSKLSNEIEPDSPSFLDTYGWILYRGGKYADAKHWLFKAIDAGGRQNSVILEHYGDSLWQLGEKNEALKYWQKAKDAGRGSDFLDKKLEDKKLYE